MLNVGLKYNEYKKNTRTYKLDLKNNAEVNILAA